MKKILFMLAMLPMMFSCSNDNPLNKSIMSQLSIEEMNQVIASNPEFQQMYKGYLENLRLSKLDSARFISITYSRLLDFYKLQDSIDAKEYLETYNKIGKEYQDIADDMVDEWIQYIIKNNNKESDSLKNIYKDYLDIVEVRMDKGNDYSKISYVLKRSSLIKEVIDKDYDVLPQFWGMSMATKHLIRKDSLCHQLFLMTKIKKRFDEDFVKAMKEMR